MITVEKIKELDDKIQYQNTKYVLNREALTIFAVITCDIDEYVFQTCKEWRLSNVEKIL